MAPFAIVAPVPRPGHRPDQGRPADDGGGRRRPGRVVVSLLMAFKLDSLLLFPLAFVALVLGRSYAVAKSALVPTVVRHEDELVEANAKLGAVAGLVGFVAAIPALILSLIGPEVTVAWSCVPFAARRRLGPHAARGRRSRRGRRRSRSGRSCTPRASCSGATAMTILRCASGFLTFLIAFWLRHEGASTAFFGVVLSASAIGTLIGNVLGPRVRQRIREELMLLAALVLTAASPALAAALVVGKLTRRARWRVSVGFSAAIARLGFDATVQQEAPDANQGRAFAQFETRFQMSWVLAAFVPVAISIPAAVGFLLVGVVALAGAVWYTVGIRTVRASGRLPEPIGKRVGRFLHKRRRLRSGRTNPPVAGHRRRPPPRRRTLRGRRPTRDVEGSSDRSARTASRCGQTSSVRAPADQRSMRASQRPGASTSAGVGSSAAELPQPRQALGAGPLEHAGSRRRGPARPGPCVSVRPSSARRRRRTRRPPRAGGAPPRRSCRPSRRGPRPISSSVWST